MAFRTRQDYEGADWRVAVKKNDTLKTNRQKPERSLSPQRKQLSSGSPFKKRPCGPVLKGRQQKPLAPGAPRGWVTDTLVPAAACHFENTKIQVGDGSCLSQRHVSSRGLNRRMLPHTKVFRPLRRSTRRCPPWTRTGLMSGDRKATRYWALGFGYGAAPAETSPAPARQKPGNRPALYPFRLQAPTIHPAHRSAAKRRVGFGSGPWPAYISKEVLVL